MEDLFSWLFSWVHMNSFLILLQVIAVVKLAPQTSKAQ